MTDAEEVRDVLARYQELYSLRDEARLDEVMDLFVPGDDVEMVGTEAVWRGDPDWALGIAAVRTLTEWDWRFWWEVELDLERAHITVEGDAAWVTLPGALVQSKRAREGTLASTCGTSLGRLQETLADESRSLEQRLTEVAHVAGARVRELQAPLGQRRAITLSAVLVRRKDKWLFHTTHWAIATE